MISNLLTVEEVATTLKVPETTIRKWLKDGKLKGVKLPNGDWRIPHDAVREMMKQ